MRELFALEIWETAGHKPNQVLYRSDLYLTREIATAAFLDLETGEAFTALYTVQNNENPPFTFAADSVEGVAPYLIDDYWQAYKTGNHEVVEAINSLLAWVKGEQKDWHKVVQFEFGIQSFVAHWDKGFGDSITCQLKVDNNKESNNA